jgi:outer membrane immunogenic protein
MKFRFLSLFVALGFPLAAQAADMSFKAAPAAPIPTWTGPYVGLNLGWARQDATSDYTIPANLLGTTLFAPTQGFGLLPTSSSQSGDNVLGGITLGYNFQRDRVVYGVEADAMGTNLNGRFDQTTSAFAFPDLRTTTTTKTDFLATIRGRLGSLITPDTLLYGTAGLAIGHVKGNTTIEPFLPGAGTSECATNAFCSAGSASRFLAGWTAGAGAEKQFGPKWSAKIEYLYYDLGSFSYNAIEVSPTFPGLAGNPNMKIDTKITGHIVRAGVNLRF